MRLWVNANFSHLLFQFVFNKDFGYQIANPPYVYCLVL